MFDKLIEPSTSPEVCAAMQDFGVSKVASGPLSVKTRDGVKPCSEITALNYVFILFFICSQIRLTLRGLQLKEQGWNCLPRHEKTPDQHFNFMKCTIETIVRPIRAPTMRQRCCIYTFAQSVTFCQLSFLHVAAAVFTWFIKYKIFHVADWSYANKQAHGYISKT